MGPGGFDVEGFLALLEARHGGEARRVLALEAVDSTSSELARRLGDGWPVGTVIVAGEQTAGRGRLGRGWCSPPGGNLHLSVAVSPAGADLLTMVPLAAGAAAAAVLAGAGIDELRLKWPNDLLARGRKLGGILCETADPLADRPVVVVGIGVNLSGSPLWADLAGAAISAAEVVGRAITPEPVAAGFVTGLERRLADLSRAGRDALISEWKDRAEPFGRRVRTVDVEGVTVDLDETGRLLVRRDDGAIVPVAGGIVETAG